MLVHRLMNSLVPFDTNEITAAKDKPRNGANPSGRAWKSPSVPTPLGTELKPKPVEVKWHDSPKRCLIRRRRQSERHSLSLRAGDKPPGSDAEATSAEERHLTTSQVHAAHVACPFEGTGRAFRPDRGDTPRLCVVTGTLETANNVFFRPCLQTFSFTLNR